jgi:hypothetical protein
MCTAPRPSQPAGNNNQLPLVYDDYFPGQKDGEAEGEDKDAKGDDQVSGLGGLKRHFEEVRQLLLHDHYIYYQPVCEACEACLNHRELPEALQFARDCFKEIFEIMLNQLPSKISPANQPNCRNAVLTAVKVCLHHAEQRDFTLMTPLTALLDANRLFYSGKAGQGGEQGLVDIHEECLADFVQLGMPVVIDELSAEKWPGCKRARQVMEPVVMVLACCRDFPAEQGKHAFDLLQRRMMDLKEEELRKEDLKEVESLMRELEKLCEEHVKGPATLDLPSVNKRDVQWCNLIYSFWLNLCLRFFKSPSLKHRFFGLDEIIFLAEKRAALSNASASTATTAANVALPPCTYLTNKMMVQWLHREQIFEEVFGGRVHADLVRRSVSLLKYLVNVPGGFTDSMVERLWKCGFGKHESEALVIRSALLEVAHRLPPKLLVRLLQFIQRFLTADNHRAIADSSEAGQAALGYTAEVVIGFRSSSIVHKAPEVIDAMLELVWTALEIPCPGATISTGTNASVDGLGVSTRREKTTQVFIDILQSEHTTDKQMDKYCKRCIDFIEDKCARRLDQRREALFTAAALAVPAQLEDLLLCMVEVLAQIVGIKSLRDPRSKSSVKAMKATLITKAMTKLVDNVISLMLKELRCLQSKQVQALEQAQIAVQADLQLQLLGGGHAVGEEGHIDLPLLSAGEWASHTWRRLELLKIVLHTSGRTLTLLQVEEVWHTLDSPVARESCCKWFRLSCLPNNTQPNSPKASLSPASTVALPSPASALTAPTSPLVDIQVCHHIFTALMCVDMMALAASIGVEGYLSFRAFFLVLNQEQRRLQLSQPFVASSSNRLELDGSTNSLAGDANSSNNHGSAINVSRVLRAPLLGLEALWKLVLYSPNENIAASASHFLVALQLAPSNDTSADSPSDLSPPPLVRSPSQLTSPSSIFLDQVFEELLQLTEKLKQWQQTNMEGQRGLLLRARRCVALLHAALQHQHHSRGRRRQQQQQQRVEEAQLLPPHGAMAQGWPCELVVRFSFQLSGNGLFSHGMGVGMGSQKIAPDSFQPSNSMHMGADQAQTLRLEAHSNHTVGQVRQFVSEWIRAEERVAKKWDASGSSTARTANQRMQTRSTDVHGRSTDVGDQRDPATEVVSDTEVVLRRRDGTELHTREDHKRLGSVNLGSSSNSGSSSSSSSSTTTSTSRAGGGGGGGLAGHVNSGNSCWEISVERPAQEWSGTNSSVGDLQSVQDDGQHMNIQDKLHHDTPHDGLEELGEDMRGLTVDTGGGTGPEGTTPLACTTPLAWCGALMASKPTLFECLFMLLGVIAEFPDSESDAHIVGLEQRVWQLLLLIPTNKKQLAMFLESPTQVNWRAELTAGTFAKQVYSLQLVEQLSNPAKALQLCLADERKPNSNLQKNLAVQETKTSERGEQVPVTKAAVIKSEGQQPCHFISDHAAVLWRQDFMRSEHGFESVVDYLENLMCEPIAGAEEHQGADGFVGEGFWVVDGVAVVLRVINCCIGPGAPVNSTGAPRLKVFNGNPSRLLGLLVRAVSRVHHMTKSRLARRKRLTSTSASSAQAVGHIALSSSFTTADSHDANPVMAGTLMAGTRAGTVDNSAETAELDERIEQLIHMALDTISCVRSVIKLQPALLEVLMLAGTGHENGLNVAFALLLEHHALEVRQAVSQMLVEIVQMCQPQAIEGMGVQVSAELSELVHQCVGRKLRDTLRELPPSGESAHVMPAGQADEFFAVFERLLHVLFPTVRAEGEAEGEAERLLELLVSNLLALDDARESARVGSRRMDHMYPALFASGVLEGDAESTDQKKQGAEEHMVGDLVEVVASSSPNKGRRGRIAGTTETGKSYRIVWESGDRGTAKMNSVASLKGSAFQGLGVSRKQARRDANRQHILSGWLVLLSALLQQCGPEVHAWVGLGRGAGGGGEGGLVSLVMRRLLFSLPSISAKGCLPLCTQQLARSSAFELLGTLSQGSCAANLHALVAIFEDMIVASLGHTGEVSMPFTFSDVQRSILLQDFGEPDAPRGEAGYVGLKNLGCTCYINSVLQQLFCTKPFRACILEVDSGTVEAKGAKGDG